MSICLKAIQKSMTKYFTSNGWPPPNENEATESQGQESGCVETQGLEI